ncbi:hypothetical protein N9934_04675, partial [Desulfosarcina sp.]|nr:hypothetical protein [Desulfosarcina sp.]
MLSKSIKGTSPEELTLALQQSMSSGFKPKLAIVFISIKQDRKAIVEILHQRNIDVIGATSSGEFINEHQSEGEFAILLLDIKRNDYSILFEDIGTRSLEQATSNIVHDAFSKFEKPAFILLTTLLRSDGSLLDGEGMVHFIEKQAGPDITMFGGMAGDDMSFTGTWIFTRDKSTDYGMAALVLDE